MDWINAGQSGCLIGLRGAGKSNFMRFLLREDVQQYYLGEDCAHVSFVYIDPLALVELSDWTYYELMLARLLDQLDRAEIEEEIVKDIASLYRDVTRSRDPLVAARAIERCIGTLCQRSAQQVVLLLDEFDDLVRALSASLFRFLRALRDAYKGQIAYVVVVTGDPAGLRNDLEEAEHFYRLISRNVCGLGPYSAADARQMIRYLASQRSIEFAEKDVLRLIELSGGHAGLLKATLSLLWDRYRAGYLMELAPRLQDEQAIRNECQKVWNSLSDSEQASLSAIAKGAQADPDTLSHLRLKGLVRESQVETPVFSPLFADFVRQQASPVAPGVLIGHSPREVQIGGRQVESLTELELEMLRYLYEHRGRLCTKDELIENVYRQKYDRMKGGVTDGALQALISRLRDKIEPDRGRPRYIVTIRGQGYKFVDATKQ